MRSIVFRVSMLALAAALAGCSATSYCTGEFPYQKARSLPPLESVDGMDLPQSQSGMTIPPPPRNAAPYATLAATEDGSRRVRCLDMPPPMPVRDEPQDADS